MPALVISNLERPSAEVSVGRSMTAEIPQGSRSSTAATAHAAAAGESAPKKPRSLIICDTSGGTIFSQSRSPLCSFHQCREEDFEIFRMIISDFDDEIVVHDESE